MNRIPVRDPAARRLRWKRRTTLLRRGCWRVAAKCWKLRMQPPRDKSGIFSIEIGDISWFSWGYNLYIYIYTMQHEGIQWLMMILLVVEHICLILFPSGDDPHCLFFQEAWRLETTNRYRLERSWKGLDIYIYIHIITKMEDDPHAALDTYFQWEKPFCCGG